MRGLPQHIAIMAILSPNPKPVLFRVTNNLKIGGVQRRLRALLPLLTDRYDVHVVTYKERGVFFDELAQLGVHVHFLPRKGHWDPVAIWKLARLFRRHHADIVHTHSFGGNIFGILAAALARVPVRIGQVHSRGLHWYGKSKFRRFRQITEESVVHALFSHKILFVSEESLEYFQKKTHLPNARLSVLHNGLSLPENQQPFLKSTFNLPEDRLLVGFVGRLTPKKGIPLFLRFIQRIIKSENDTFHFVIIGSGNISSYKEMAKKLNILQFITFTGEIQDIHRVYPLLDVLMFTSKAEHEGMPGVVLEACAHGLPILAQKSRPIQEISAYYSRIFYLNDAETPEVQIRQALNSPPADLAMFTSEFSITAMHQRTVKIYQELLGKK